MLEEKAKILVVDDEDRTLRLIEAMLLPLGYEVILAGDGEEALAKVTLTGRCWITTPMAGKRLSLR